VPKAVGDRPDTALKPDSSLKDRLRTLEPPPNAAAVKTQPPAVIPQSAAKAKPPPLDEWPRPQGLLSDAATRALKQLGPKPISLADICAHSGLSSAEAMAALTELELAGLSRQLAGRQFIMMM
jgi:predicted Rossmann fold nucleotide-binding protein DprA/Smf involved in DNA uptake